MGTEVFFVCVLIREVKEKRESRFTGAPKPEIHMNMNPQGNSLFAHYMAVIEAASGKRRCSTKKEANTRAKKLCIERRRTQVKML